MNALGLVLFWGVAQVTVLALVAGLMHGATRRLGPAIGAFVSVNGLLLMSVKMRSRWRRFVLPPRCGAPRCERWPRRSNK
jgi:hypothetical protein